MKQYIFNLKPIYEIVTGIEHSVCDVVEAFKVDVPLTSEKTPYETDRSVADISAINALGWEAKRSIYDECNNETFFYNVFSRDCRTLLIQSALKKPTQVCSFDMLV